MNQFLPNKQVLPQATKRGVVILLFLIVILLALRYLLPEPQFPVEDISEFNRQIEQYYLEMNARDSMIKPKKLNPNTASFSALVQIGLSKNVAGNILKYRKAGGYFKQVSDLKRIYGITDSMYIDVKPYVVFPPPKEKQTEWKRQVVKKSKNDTYTNTKQLRNIDKTDRKAKKILQVDINQADSSQLVTVRGIGPTFAHGIIAYRNLLGGYVSKQQLLEVYGLANEYYQAFEPYVCVSCDSVEQINLNTATFKAINSHPYISYNQTKSLVRYRDIMEQFDSVEVIINNHLMDSISYKKVRPYLCAK